MFQDNRQFWIKNLESKILHILDVKAETFKTFWLSFLFSFLINFALNVMYSVPTAMFLARYESSSLPYIYIGSGVVTAIFGSLFIFFKQRTALLHLLMHTVAIVAISLLAFWFIFLFSDVAWVYYFFYIWAWSACIVLETVYAILINQIFSLQEGKRLFGLLAGSAALGGVVSGFGMNFLIDWIGMVNLIFLSALIVFACLPIIASIQISAGNKASAKTSTKINVVQLDIFKNKYFIFFLFFTSIAFTFQYYAFDLLFNTEVKNYFASEKEMANFYSYLFAIYHLFALLVSFFVYNWILKRFGLFTSLYILPIGMGICMLAVMIAGSVSKAHLFYFWTLAISACFENTARSSIYTQSFLLLFQPLPAHERAWSQVQVEFKVIPIAIVGIGVLLSILNWYGHISYVYNCLIILFFALLIFICIVFLKQGYIKTLMESLSHRKFSNQNLMKINKENLDFLKEKIKSTFPDEVIYVLQIIESMDLSEFAHIIEMHLNHPSALVRKYMVEKIAQYEMKNTKASLIKLCVEEKDFDVLSKALLALGKVADIDSLSWFRDYTQGKNIKLATSALVAYIKFGSPSSQKVALATISKKAHSSHPEDLILAIEVLKHIHPPYKMNVIIDCLKNPNLAVRQEACQAAILERDSRFYPLLFDNLALHATHIKAFEALVAQGSSLVAYIESHLGSFSFNIKLESIKIIGFIDGPQSIFFLESLLNHTNRKILKATFTALNRHAYVAKTAKKQNAIRYLLAKENENILSLQAIARTFNFYQTIALLGLLNREIEVCQECCLLLLSFIYPSTPIMHVLKGLSLGGDLMDYVEELLLNTLSKKDIDTFLPQLIYRGNNSLPHFMIDAKEGPLSEHLVKILEYAPTSYLTGLAAAAVYTIGALPFKPLIEAIPTYQSSDDPFLEETRTWALKKNAISEDNMNVFEKLLFLKTTALFSALKDDTLLNLASITQELKVKNEECIIKEGELDTTMYIIVTGKVKVHKAQQIIKELAEREVFGELAALYPNKRIASVTAVEETILLKIDQSDLYDLMENHFELAKQIIYALCQRIREISRETLIHKIEQ